MLSVGNGKRARLVIAIIALVGIGLVLMGCGSGKKVADLEKQVKDTQAQVTKLQADLKTANDGKAASDKAANDAKAQVTTLNNQLKAYDITPYVATWTWTQTNGGKVQIVIKNTGDVTLTALDAAGQTTSTATGVGGLLPKGEFAVHAGAAYMSFTSGADGLKLVSVVGADQFGAPGTVFKK